MTAHGSPEQQTAIPRGPRVWLPLLILAGATALILLLDLDLRFQRFFFNEEEGWWMMDRWLQGHLYDYGVWPAIGLALAAALAGMASLAVKRLRHWLRPALSTLLVLGLGPGLLVHTIFKSNFGRPRPDETSEFGRYQEFRPLLQKGESGQGTSFPSGHASMGFYLMVPGFFLLSTRRRLARLFLVIGLLAGCLIGLARISAGAHFLGDVLWSWGMVHLSALACYFLLYTCRTKTDDLSG